MSVGSDVPVVLPVSFLLGVPPLTFREVQSQILSLRGLHLAPLDEVETTSPFGEAPPLCSILVSYFPCHKVGVLVGHVSRTPSSLARC